MRKILFILLLALATPLLNAKTTRWEQVADTLVNLTTPGADADAQEQEPVIIVRDQYVYISLPQTSQVSVINILGHPIEDTMLDEGTYRLRLPSRGIYIVKSQGKIARITI